MIRNALYIFGVCATVFVIFLPSYLQMQELHNKNHSYEQQIRELGRENEALQEEKRRLEEDPAYFERFAREKLGIIKDGEVIYRIVPTAGAGSDKLVNSVASTNAQVLKENETAAPEKKETKPAVKASSPKAAVKKPVAASETKKKRSTSSGKKEKSVAGSSKSAN